MHRQTLGWSARGQSQKTFCPIRSLTGRIVIITLHHLKLLRIGRVHFVSFCSGRNNVHIKTLIIPLDPHKLAICSLLQLGSGRNVAGHFLARPVEYPLQIAAGGWLAAMMLIL